MQEDDDFETPFPISSSIRQFPKMKTNTIRKCKINSPPPKRSKSSQSSKENVPPLIRRGESSSAFHPPLVGKRLDTTTDSKENVSLMDCGGEVDLAFHPALGGRSGKTVIDPEKVSSCLIVSREQQVFTDGSEPSDSEHSDEYVSLVDCGGETHLVFHRTVGEKTLSCMIESREQQVFIDRPEPSEESDEYVSLTDCGGESDLAFHRTGGGQSRKIPIDHEKSSSCLIESRERQVLTDRSELSEENDEYVSLGDCGGEADLAFHRTVIGRSIDIPVDPEKPCSNSIEARLLASSRVVFTDDVADEVEGDFESSSQLDILLRLCSDGNENGFHDCNLAVPMTVECPVCSVDISDMDEEARQLHTNACLDKCDSPKISVENDRTPKVLPEADSAVPVESTSKVAEWLRSLGLEKYEAAFTREEIDWDTLKWMTEEDLIKIGVTALGPRKKIMLALKELTNGGAQPISTETETDNSTLGNTKKLAASRLITDYFLGPGGNKIKSTTRSGVLGVSGKDQSHPNQRRLLNIDQKHATSRKPRDIPIWCTIPGTQFRVDAFKHLRRDCSHWFLTHFHADHYQGLTRSFSHGKIYCSIITARLVHMKLGIPWNTLEVLPLNERVNIDGVHVTCFDANHCPGSVIILFEPPNGKAVLHTGDFRFCEEMARLPALAACPIHTLILDTTYCNPQYDFPKQEEIIQFVIEAIQAESFHPKTLFLIGSYTIGKERLFLEVARVLRKKIYVTAAKLRILECLELPKEDMQWLTKNEHESHIHVVPLWSLASFKRLKQLSHQYTGRFNLIVAFSPTGWSFGKGKKSTGKRWQQGTIIRYEVPYSEHSSFTELKQCVQLIRPVDIIPSVNNRGKESSEAMVAQLIS